MGLLYLYLTAEHFRASHEVHNVAVASAPNTRMRGSYLHENLKMRFEVLTVVTVKDNCALECDAV
jgi:hypothetical protein